MSIYKRGGKYWFKFVFRGERIQRSTRQSDRKVARQMEAAYRTALARGELGLLERKPAPALKDFAQRFIDAIQARGQTKPNTVLFYLNKLARLLEFEPLALAPLDKIDETLIETYVQHRISRVSPASVNRELATLRRLLRLAHEWREIDRVPRIRLLPAERVREFVLSHAQERNYLEFAPQPLRDVAILMLDTGLRVSEALALEWRDVHLEPASGARFGYIHVREGKSKNAKRNLSLTARVRAMLEAWWAANNAENADPRPTASQRVPLPKSPWVFTSEDGKEPLSIFTLEAQHSAIRRTHKLAKDFVLHSMRHTFGTRLGEAGADAFTIMRLMGHSTVTVSQRYVHPTPETLESAFERLEALNNRATALLVGQKQPGVATILATADKKLLSA